MPTSKLDTFVADIDRLVDEFGNNENELLQRAQPLLEALVSTDDWLDDKYAQPHPQYYQQYCLYACPKGRFSLVSFVWGPGQQTPVHDHTVWGLIGMLRGAEAGQRYKVQQDGSLAAEGREELHPGMVDRVSPSHGDIHQVFNLHDDQVSISIHLYGADIGKVSRHVYVPETGEKKTFISGYSQPPK